MCLNVATFCTWMWKFQAKFWRSRAKLRTCSPPIQAVALLLYAWPQWTFLSRAGLIGTSQQESIAKLFSLRNKISVYTLVFLLLVVHLSFTGRLSLTCLLSNYMCDPWQIEKWWIDLNWGAWTFPSFLYPCLVLTLVWFFLLANSKHYVFVCVCSSQSGVPEVQNLGQNSPYLCAHLSPQTLKNLRWWKTSKGKPINKLTQWLQEFLRKSAKAKGFRIQAGKTSLQFGTHQQDGFYPSLCL